MGWRIAKIEVEPTHQLEPIIALVKERRHQNMVRKIIDGLLFTNTQSRGTYDFMQSMTHDSDVHRRYAAVTSFWTGGHLDTAATCKMWEEHLDDPDDDVAAISAQHLGWWSDCSANFDTLLSKVDKRLKASHSASQGFGIGLEKLCEDKQSRPAQRAKAAGIAKQLASSKDAPEFPRMEGLEAAVSCDPKNGKRFAARFTHDRSEWLAKKAKELAMAK
jgi:hypothetical protein